MELFGREPDLVVKQVIAPRRRIEKYIPVGVDCEEDGSVVPRNRLESRHSCEGHENGFTVAPHNTRRCELHRNAAYVGLAGIDRSNESIKGDGLGPISWGGRGHDLCELRCFFVCHICEGDALNLLIAQHDESVVERNFSRSACVHRAECPFALRTGFRIAWIFCDGDGAVKLKPLERFPVLDLWLENSNHMSTGGKLARPAIVQRLCGKILLGLCDICRQ